MSKVYAFIFVMVFYLLVITATPYVGASMLASHASVPAYEVTSLNFLDIMTGVFKEGFDPYLAPLSVFLMIFHLITFFLVILIIRGD